MAIAEEKQFKYPAEEECLVRRLGSAVITSWSALPREVQETLFAAARTAWDREYYVPRLNERLEGIVRRRRG